MKVKFFLASISSVFLMFSSNSTFADNHDELATAQQKLEEAAREYAELASGLGENANVFVRSMKMPQLQTHSNKARLGIHIGQTIEKEVVNGEEIISEAFANGVNIMGVSKDGPAEKAGLQEGDLITHLNGQDLRSGEKDSMQQLFDVMKNVNPGDSVDLSYQRDGISYSTSVLTDEMSNEPKIMMLDKDFDIQIDSLDGLAKLEGLKGLENMKFLDGEKHIVKRFNKHIDGKDGFSAIFFSSSPLGDAELVELSPDLGAYFKADKGLLLVKAPSDENTPLKDGDVIQSIDSREVNSVSQAMRILRSYEEGENVNLAIKRNKRNRTVSITIPEKQDMANINVLEDVFKWKEKTDSDN